MFTTNGHLISHVDNIYSLQNAPKRQKTDVYKLLEQFYKSYYQPKAMKLVVMAPIPLENLYKIVLVNWQRIYVEVMGWKLFNFPNKGFVRTLVRQFSSWKSQEKQSSTTSTCAFLSIRHTPTFQQGIPEHTNTDCASQKEASTHTYLANTITVEKLPVCCRIGESMSIFCWHDDRNWASIVQNILVIKLANFIIFDVILPLL